MAVAQYRRLHSTATTRDDHDRRVLAALRQWVAARCLNVALDAAPKLSHSERAQRAADGRAMFEERLRELADPVANLAAQVRAKGGQLSPQRKGRPAGGGSGD